MLLWVWRGHVDGAALEVALGNTKTLPKLAYIHSTKIFPIMGCAWAYGVCHFLQRFVSENRAIYSMVTSFSDVI